ncbi:hypothetical protein QTP86_017795 [Hemibagrus guttatus]|nr:hypothetical protein QTP86_017795 [Hemibagrus guttatus]
MLLVLMTGVVGACGISVLSKLLRVYLFIEAQSIADSKDDIKNKRIHIGGLTDRIQFWILTATLTCVGSRAASLVVLEFSLRTISSRFTTSSDVADVPRRFVMKNEDQRRWNKSDKHD